jgi:copper homeostasis protein CutC
VVLFRRMVVYHGWGNSEVSMLLYDWGAERLQLCQQLPFEVLMPHDGMQMTHVCIQSPLGLEILIESPFGEMFYNEDDHSYISAALDRS